MQHPVNARRHERRHDDEPVAGFFDEPVDVVTSELFSAFRQRVTATVGINGVSLARTSNGQPQMRFTRI